MYTIAQNNEIKFQNLSAKKFEENIRQVPEVVVRIEIQEFYPTVQNKNP